MVINMNAVAVAIAGVAAIVSVFASVKDIVIAIMSAKKITITITRVYAIAIVNAIAFAFVSNSDSSILTQNIFQLLPTLKDMPPKDILKLFTIFFFIMPISNALIDSLSLSVSRYEFQKLLSKTTYNFLFFLKISLVDFFYALIFKIFVLGVLYIGVIFLQKTGATFQVSDIDIYFNCIIKAIFQDESFSFLFTDSTNTMITLMVSTTLLPTIIHFVTVLFNTIWAFLANSIGLFGLFFRGNGIFFSAVMSVIFLLFLLALFFMMFYILKIT